YRFVVVGYVVMQEHVHLLISEPEQGTPSTVMQVVKQRFARRVLCRKRRKSGQLKLWAADDPHVWQTRLRSFEFAQDFGSGLRRPLIASTSTYGASANAPGN